jgi:hypothetical protein
MGVKEQLAELLADPDAESEEVGEILAVAVDDIEPVAVALEVTDVELVAVALGSVYRR